MNSPRSVSSGRIGDSPFSAPGSRVRASGFETAVPDVMFPGIQRTQRFRDDMGVVASVSASMETLMNSLEAKNRRLASQQGQVCSRTSNLVVRSSQPHPTPNPPGLCPATFQQVFRKRLPGRGVGAFDVNHLPPRAGSFTGEAPREGGAFASLSL